MASSGSCWGMSGLGLPAYWPTRFRASVPEEKNQSYRHWIDDALDRIEGGTEGRVIWGNETELVRAGQLLHARSLYKLFAAEQMPLADFEAVLRTYRDAVMSAIAAGAKLHADGYEARRNPLP